MPFNNELPEWNKTATAPTTTKKNAGWSAGEKPPASIFDWFFNTTFKALQELQQEAINADQKGVVNGVAPLDSSGKVPAANLPAIAPPVWTNLTLQNGWVWYGGVEPQPQYSKDGNIVKVRGTIKSGTDGISTVLFTLPPGYRPSSNTYTTTISSGNQIVRLRITTAGEGQIFSTPVNTAWLMLDDIIFIAQ